MKIIKVLSAAAHSTSAEVTRQKRASNMPAAKETASSASGKELKDGR
jgi:hypothetical protein